MGFILTMVGIYCVVFAVSAVLRSLAPPSPELSELRALRSRMEAADADAALEAELERALGTEFPSASGR